MSIPPEGIWHGRAIFSEIRSAMSTSTEWIEVTFKANLDQEDESPIEDEEIPWKGYLTKKAEDRTIEQMQLCGWYGNDIRTAMDDGLSLNEVDLDVRHEEYKGKTTARVAFIGKLGTLGALDDDRLKSIADRIKQKVKATEPPEQSKVSKPKTKKKATPESDFGPPPGGDDDIPF